MYGIYWIYWQILLMFYKFDLTFFVIDDVYDASVIQIQFIVLLKAPYFQCMYNLYVFHLNIVWYFSICLSDLKFRLKLLIIS